MRKTKIILGCIKTYLNDKFLKVASKFVGLCVWACVAGD